MARGELARSLGAARARVLGLIARERIREIEAEARRIEQREARFAPWVAHLCALTRSFQLKKLRELVDAGVSRATEDSSKRSG